MKTALLIILMILVCAENCTTGLAGSSPPNLAQEKAYTLEPNPNYPHCTDPADAVQLTDGQFVNGYFWTQPGTVGWSGQSPVLITIDLGKVEPIAGLSFSTAAGVAGVAWPASIFVLVSDDRETWHLAGDLVALSAMSAPPPGSGYAQHRFQTHELAARGRFVQLVVAPTLSYAFVDEIEVWRGPEALLQNPPAGQEIKSVRKFFDQSQIGIFLRRRLQADLASVRQAWQDHAGDQSPPSFVQRELDQLEQAIPSVSVADPETFITVFPMHSVHSRIFALQAALWRATSRQGVMIWHSDRWAMLNPITLPSSETVALEVAMMKNEYRSTAFNLSNAGEETVQVSLSLDGLPGGAHPDYVTIHDVPFTDTKAGTPVAAALPVLPLTQDRYTLSIPPGLTRQVWLSFHPKTVSPGVYAGRIRLAGEHLTSDSIPLTLRLYPMTFPNQPSLHLGGWDYTDQERCYEVTPENRDAFLQHLREHFVDSPWAQSAVMPHGCYDASGGMIEGPNPAPFRTWLDRWPKARHYFVFANAGKTFEGFPLGSPPFQRAVSEWINWWVAKLQEWSVQPHQLGLLIVDEPHQHEQDRIIIEYAKVIRAAQPEVVIWEDPIWTDPQQATPELYELSHVLCPNLPMWLVRGPAFGEFYRQQRQAGRRLWLYSCSGPGRLLDPYSYHRLQPWFCWTYGAEGCGYWAFGDSNGASSWNEYASHIGAFTPLFLDANGVTPGKHMEAIREGIEDYEYLCILRDRIQSLDQKHIAHPSLPAARHLLQDAPGRVTAPVETNPQQSWTAQHDRSIADQVRLEILEMLTRLDPEQ